MKRILVLFAVIFSGLLARALPANDALSLDGSWRFQLDRTNVGIAENWAAKKLSSQLSAHIHLPGSLPEQNYNGAAWFQRSVTIPLDWKNQRVVLTLERPHWQTQVWLDGKNFGTNDSLGTPHEYDLGQLAPGKHTLTIRVGSSDRTQDNWNGIVGDLSLRVTPRVWIEDLQVYPHVATHSATVTGSIGNVSGADGEAGMLFYVDGKLAQSVVADWTTNGGTFTGEIPLGDTATNWDEFHPAVRHLTAKLGDATRSTTFGLHEIPTQGTQFVVNERVTFFCGTLESCVFPLTGHPPMDVDSWKRIIAIAKAHGLNLFHFDSWCPPEAAFSAADELGFYFQIEPGSGEETERILKTYGNHPSFVLLAGGSNFAARDPRRLWTGASGATKSPQNQFDVALQNGLATRLNAQPPATMTDYGDIVGSRDVPVISHETSQWRAHPNFAGIKKYKGDLKRFAYASGKLQALCCKEEIESALRTPGLGGFELPGLKDFFDQDFSRFCNAVVPLARLQKRVFTADENLSADLEVANFGAAPLADATPYCELVADGGRVVASQVFDRRTVPVDDGIKLGTADFSLKNVPAPARYKLVAGFAGTKIQNDWDVWVYPAQAAPKAPVEAVIFHELNAAALAVLDSGGTVLWLLPPENVRNDPAHPVKLGFSGTLGNTTWTNQPATTTLGILCDSRSPLFAEFPTDDFSNWQWWYLIHRAQPMILDDLPVGLLPDVQVIDEWASNRKLALAFEAKAGNGKIFVCSVDLENDLANDPVRRQFRTSLLDYLASPRFQPKWTVDAATLQQLAK